MKGLFFTILFSFVSLASIAQGKIGYLNTEKVLDTMPSRKKAMDQAGLMQRLGQQELMEKDSLINAKINDIKNHPEWAQSTIDYAKRQVARMDQEFQYRQQELEQEIQIFTNEQNKKVTDRVKAAVATVSKAKGLSYVLDENSLLFKSGGTDITPDVIKEILRLEALDK